MKRIILVFTFLFFLTSCGEDQKGVGENEFYYTVTDFETLGDENNLNDHFNTKKALTSKVYKVSFQNINDFKRELIKESEDEIVYHDFCIVGEKLYAVGGQFGKHNGTARMVQVIPESDQSIVLQDDEIRFRDCEAIGNNIGIVSHGEGKMYVFDEKTGELKNKNNSSFYGEIDNKSYSGVTMIHEIVTADLNGDNESEWYYTPTSKNGPTYIDQKGKIFQAFYDDKVLKSKEYYDLGDSYAKEVHKLILNNGKEVLLLSIQGKTDKSDGSVIRPTVIKALYENDGKMLEKDILSIDTPQCRVIEYGNITSKENIDLLVGCNNGLIAIYKLENDLSLKLYDQYEVRGKQVHSFLPIDVDGNGLDEVFIGIDHDGLYYYDASLEENRLQKIYDYSKQETWVWAIDSFDK